MTSAIKKLEPLPRPYSILWGEQIHISGLNKTQRRVSITSEDKYEYQLIPIQFMKKQRSKTNKGSIGQVT